MGAWGAQPFENDFALDFTAELFHGEAGDLSLLGEVFNDIFQAKAEGYIEADQSNAAIAAAAILVYLKQGNPQELVKIQANSEAWFKAATSENYQSLIPAALKALDTITANRDASEAYELWAETEYLGEWLESIAKISTTLKA